MNATYRAALEADRAALEAMLRQDAGAGWEMPQALDLLSAALVEDEIVGLLRLESFGDGGDMAVFVAPAYRRRGIGAAAVLYGEGVLRERGAERIHADYLAAREDAVGFAAKMGYGRNFSSAYMTRAAVSFGEDCPFVRPYRDEDYADAHALHEEAFHMMRLSVGDFPDSQLGQPSEKSRADWLTHAADRYVYEMDGEIVGYSHIEDGELSSVSVRPDLQGRGIGEGFVKWLVDEIYRRGHKEATLWCVEGNRARHLYDRLGFTQRHVSIFSKKTL